MAAKMPGLATRRALAGPDGRAADVDSTEGIAARAKAVYEAERETAVDNDFENARRLVDATLDKLGVQTDACRLAGISGEFDDRFEREFGAARQA